MRLRVCVRLQLCVRPWVCVWGPGCVCVWGPGVCVCVRTWVCARPALVVKWGCVILLKLKCKCFTLQWRPQKCHSRCYTTVLAKLEKIFLWAFKKVKENKEREARHWFSLPDFTLTQSSFILFKQIRDSKTSKDRAQHPHFPLCFCLPLFLSPAHSSFGFNLIKKRAAGRRGRADAHLISGPSVCSAGWLPALYPTRPLPGKGRDGGRNRQKSTTSDPEEAEVTFYIHPQMVVWLMPLPLISFRPTFSLTSSGWSISPSFYILLPINFFSLLLFWMLKPAVFLFSSIISCLSQFPPKMWCIPRQELIDWIDSKEV